MTSQESKRFNLRFSSVADLDLITRAAARSGLTISEWSRRTLVKAAEEQIHKTSNRVLLKNILLVRRILEIAKIVPDDDLRIAKNWARVEAETASQNDGPQRSSGGDGE